MLEIPRVVARDDSDKNSNHYGDHWGNHIDTGLRKRVARSRNNCEGRRQTVLAGGFGDNNG